MAKQSSKRSVDSVSESGLNKQSEIEILLERLKLAFEYSQKSLAKAQFNPVKDDVADYIETVANNSDIPITIRIEYLRKIVGLGTSLIEKITPKVPEKPPALWKERGSERRSMSPCDFVREHYKSYGYTLTQSDIRRLDIQLYNALHNYKKNVGWPEKFDLPSKRTAAKK